MIKSISYYIYVVICISLLASCGSDMSEAQVAEPIEQVEEGVKVKVTHYAGDYMHEEDKYLPMPFNMGERSGHQFIILSNRLSKKSVNVRPIGLATTTEYGKPHKYIICIPMEKGHVFDDVNKFSQFAAQHGSAMWIIEQYLTNHSGKLGSTIFEMWNDETSAISLLLQKKENKEAPQ